MAATLEGVPEYSNCDVDREGDVGDVDDVDDVDVDVDVGDVDVDDVDDVDEMDDATESSLEFCGFTFNSSSICLGSSRVHS